MSVSVERIDSPVGNRLQCRCGGEQFFVLGQAEERPGDEDMTDSVECSACHAMYRLVAIVDRQLCGAFVVLSKAGGV